VIRFDEIGYWSEVKLDIVRDYASAYSMIMAAQQHPQLHHVYVDAFAGAGIHVARSTGGYVAGSPLNALRVRPQFKEYFLIDIGPDKVGALREAAGHRPEVHIEPDDCNLLLLEQVFPRVRYEDYRRGLCLLDPYGLDLDWRVMATAGAMRSLEMFLNFPVMDMNRNVLWRSPEGVDPADVERMDRFWGDDSWRHVMYSTTGNLFGWEEKSGDNETIARAFQDRLRNRAGFTYVPDPLPMRNSKGNTVYYLFFASQNDTGDKIVKAIFAKYRTRGR
jgi:three-Cys-motif partner protein